MKAALPKGCAMTDIDAKQVRLSQIRAQIAQYENWFHPEPDEVEHLINLAREWAAIGKLEVSQADLNRHWRDSVFPSLVRFCRGELGRLSGYCEQRQTDGLPTLSANVVWIIKQLHSTDSLEEIEQYCEAVNHVFVADILARIMRTSYRAMYQPSFLTEAILQELRGDMLEVMARTYADIIEVMREQAKKAVDAGLTQVKTTKAAISSVKKLDEKEEAGMKAAAVVLQKKHPEWSNVALAKELHKQFPKLSVNRIRQLDWLKNLTKP